MGDEKIRRLRMAGNMVVGLQRGQSVIDRRRNRQENSSRDPNEHNDPFAARTRTRNTCTNTQTHTHAHAHVQDAPGGDAELRTHLDAHESALEQSRESSSPATSATARSCMSRFRRVCTGAVHRAADKIFHDSVRNDTCHPAHHISSDNGYVSPGNADMHVWSA